MIVCGYGRSGQALAQFLEREKVPGDRARLGSRARARGGGRGRLGGLRRRVAPRGAGRRGAVARATAVVVSFADTPKALAILAHVHELRPELPVVVRTFDDTRRRAAARRGRRRDRGRGGRGLAHARHADDDAAGHAAEPRAAPPARGAPAALQLAAAASSPAPPTEEADAEQPRLRTIVIGARPPRRQDVAASTAGMACSHRAAPHRRARDQPVPETRARGRRAGAARHAGALRAEIRPAGLRGRWSGLSAGTRRRAQRSTRDT